MFSLILEYPGTRVLLTFGTTFGSDKREVQHEASHEHHMINDFTTHTLTAQLSSYYLCARPASKPAHRMALVHVRVRELTCARTSCAAAPRDHQPSRGRRGARALAQEPRAARARFFHRRRGPPQSARGSKRAQRRRVPGARGCAPRRVREGRRGARSRARITTRTPTIFAPRPGPDAKRAWREARASATRTGRSRSRAAPRRTAARSGPARACSCRSGRT